MVHVPEWVDESKSCFKDCLQQLKKYAIYNIKLNFSENLAKINPQMSSFCSKAYLKHLLHIFSKEFLTVSPYVHTFELSSFEIIYFLSKANLSVCIFPENQKYNIKINKMLPFSLPGGGDRREGGKGKRLSCGFPIQLY